MQLVLLFMPDCSFNIFFERKTGKGHVNSQGILKGQKSALENSLLLCLKVFDMLLIMKMGATATPVYLTV